MTDIAIRWIPAEFRGDWAIGPDGDVEHDADLATAVLISLFTHRTASEDYVHPDAVSDPRGWWGDMFGDDADRIGSRLWQYYRTTKTDSTLADLRDVCIDALSWLVRDGVASNVDVNTQWYGRSGVAITVTVQQGNSVAQRFSYVWAGGT